MLLVMLLVSVCSAAEITTVVTKHFPSTISLLSQAASNVEQVVDNSRRRRDHGVRPAELLAQRGITTTITSTIYTTLPRGVKLTSTSTLGASALEVIVAATTRPLSSSKSGLPTTHTGLLLHPQSTTRLITTAHSTLSTSHRTTSTSSARASTATATSKPSGTGVAKTISKAKLSTAAYVGLGIGICAIFALGALALFICLRCKRSGRAVAQRGVGAGGEEVAAILPPRPVEGGDAGAGGISVGWVGTVKKWSMALIMQVKGKMEAASATASGNNGGGGGGGGANAKMEEAGFDMPVLEDRKEKDGARTGGAQEKIKSRFGFKRHATGL